MAAKTATQDVVQEDNKILAALGDVQKNMMGAVNGIRQDLGKLARRVDGIESEVKAIKGVQPELKTRIVHQQAPAPVPQAAVPAPQPAAIPAPQPMTMDELSDIGPGGIVRGTNCYQVCVTKCRSSNYQQCWKLLLRLRGFDRPATIVGWHGPQELIGMMGEVWPEISLDTFDEGTYAQKYAERLAEDPQAAPPIIQIVDANFKADWYQSKPNILRHTHIKVVRVYP